MTTDNERLRRMAALLRLWASQKRALERIDKWCHGGIVSYRLPLWYRLDCANRVHLA